MSEERSDRESVLASDGAVGKRRWHPPELEEVDVMDTEAGTPTYDPADGGTYQTS
jgi:hypothetical protein